MVQADAFGIPVGQVLRVQSSEIRIKRRQWAEEMAQKVPVKILVPLIFCILPCLFIAVLGPAAIAVMDSFSGKVGSTVTDVGRVALAARVFTIAALTPLAALAGSEYIRGALLVLLTAVFAVGLSMTHRLSETAVATLEGAVVATLAILTYPDQASVTPYLVIPALIAALDRGGQGTAARGGRRVRADAGALGAGGPAVGPRDGGQRLHLAGRCRGHRPDGIRPAPGAAAPMPTPPTAARSA